MVYGVTRPNSDHTRHSQQQIPFIQSRASWQVIVTSGLIMLLGAWLPLRPIGQWFGMLPLPAAYWPLLLLTLVSYVVLTQEVKVWMMRMNWP